MSSAKTIPDGLNFRKRKRTSTGEDVSTTGKASGRAPAPATTISLQRPDPFERTIQNLVNQLIPVPPPTALQQMRQMCSDAVSSYKAAHVTLQKAVATHQKFATASSNGTPVSSVVNHMRLPPHQTLSGVPDVMGDERVVAALEASEKDTAVARGSAVTFLTTVYAVQVERALQLVDVVKCADTLGNLLDEYCVRIITRAGDPDTKVWQPCVSALKAAFMDEFKAVRFEVTTRQEKEAAAKEAKAQAVETARHDAEMADANRPIEEIVTEKVNVAVNALKETMETEKKKARTNPPDADSKPKQKQKTQTKPKAATSKEASKTTSKETSKESSSKEPSKPSLKQSKLKLEKKSGEKSGKDQPVQGGKGGAGGTRAEEKPAKAKPKGHGKAKAKPTEPETSEESSDDSD
ncbi:hypothetical protein MSAN_00148500 [Mycena sanguinolenta]|uniref:Uncharacterized protein n=1 Tax=Mycena sanguinolenta TaxID=230812 RepID=A0A8H6ZGE5_9AGAR|nr:hypothetical protein MSAN_00148500 [Mycena sanguinolenta]